MSCKGISKKTGVSSVFSLVFTFYSLPGPVLPFNHPDLPFTPLCFRSHFNGFTLSHQKAHMTEITTIEDKVRQIINEMKAAGLWKKQAPDWVIDYEKRVIGCQQDFSGWLQFVFLPNCMQGMYKNIINPRRKHIVLQAKRFLENDMQQGKLLQLLIELDALV